MQFTFEGSCPLPAYCVSNRLEMSYLHFQFLPFSILFVFAARPVQMTNDFIGKRKESNWFW